MFSPIFLMHRKGVQENTANHQISSSLINDGVDRDCCTIMKYSIYWTYIVILYFCSNVWAKDTVVYTEPYLDHSPNQFYLDLLKIALDNTVNTHGQYVLKKHQIPMNHSRQIRKVMSGELSILFTMATDELNNKMSPVKFPLLNGAIGQRIFIIHKQNQQLFNDITHRDDLKKMLAIQGQDWPDVKILQANGFMVDEVRSNTIFSNFLRLIENGQADYFPRGYMEPWIELNKFKTSNLIIEKKHLLQYPAYMHFYTQLHSPLASRLLQGLNIARDNGQFKTLFLNSAEINHAINQVNLKGRMVHHLSNPKLSYTLEHIEF